ncbi:MAG: 2-isopropylmalate synthase [bacterium]
MNPEKEEKKVKIFDTTLRDGEQSPGASLNAAEKLEIARQLARMKVDIIEAGFPISSQGDFEAVQQVAREVKGPTIAGLARSRKGDIETCARAVEPAEKGRIHVFIATSDIHVEQKLEKTKQEVLDTAVEAVEYAKTFVDDVQFSPEDAARTQPDFLREIVEAVIAAGATTVNIPDTVGYAVPEQFANIISDLKTNVPNIDDAVISVHCHNDLGLAVANSLAAVKAGAGQVEVAVNGIGERAGNAALEEIVMGLKTRQDYYGVGFNLDTTQIARSSRLVSSLTGLVVQRNKAIVGANAFAHEAGIHQHGVLKEPRTYEIMRAEDIGLEKSEIVLGKHSGRHAFRSRLEDLGYELDDQALEKAFERFKALADKKKEIFDEDLEVIIEDEVARVPEVYTLKYVHVLSGNTVLPTATVELESEDGIKRAASSGDGPVDAVYSAINQITGLVPQLNDYSIRSVTRGQDALGEVTVKMTLEGEVVHGRGASTDVLEASARAYLAALNRAIHRKKSGDTKKVEDRI